VREETTAPVRAVDLLHQRRRAAALGGHDAPTPSGRSQAVGNGAHELARRDLAHGDDALLPAFTEGLTRSVLAIGESVADGAGDADGTTTLGPAGEQEGERKHEADLSRPCP